MTTVPMHPTDLITLAFALGAPLAAFAVIILATGRRPHLSAGIAIAAVSLSATAAFFLLIRHAHPGPPALAQTAWVRIGDVTVSFGVLLDGTSVLMLCVVAAISFLVQLYSLGYMAGDPGFSRYYGYMSLFAWAMLSLTVSGSLLQLYIFWELVGLASYLLIGFWFETFSASQAGKKAFVMTRFGDVAFLLGLVLLWLPLGRLGIADLNDPQLVAAHLSPGRITWCTLLIFGGIVGKSAQFPLLTWLPDAMEGPTPVSALLHSATMVAAGVYLFARLYGLFSLSPTTMAVCLAIGTISMLMAATMATVSRDIKQVWAFSTISQLGFMLMGLGAGSFYAGVFHLTTHAGFKALLFLCAGVFIHHFGTNDMVTIGKKGGRGLKTAMATLAVGAAALSGVPPLSGFFSKEMILGQLGQLPNPVWLTAGLAGTFLTAYYTFRLIFIIGFPKVGADAGDAAGGQHGSHGRGSALVMAIPLVILAAVSLVLGWMQAPLERFLSGGLAAGALDHGVHHAWLPVAALTLVAAAIALAWVEFGRRRATQIGFVERMPALAALFAQRWYLDHLYRWMLDRLVYGGLARLFAANDRKVIDGLVDGTGGAVIALGKRSARWHLGRIQYRLIVLFATVALLALYFGFGG